ncbi:MULTISPECIES: 30S ribosome-binding factor RbfA [Fructobacillus]|uniref:Ribosome-binding factor A n=1 Tax=Fructobacillus evanidus TaxID=3064281 RepID=A0ABM9ML91_9LACO|nr:Ribosome-binding factor RbfA (RbfA) [Fructobacillus sp. LMG 32999]CAK1237200.1 Ribosome-binding factor RbfA (RbfA) [Fructobacillus tropaeoli]CAK1222591.1 Ribosome-binding factor RbfA (RbfA) [Fructobacillus sp. LMG 32999]CAK1223820.1 Ribosome-binding factor RbfA (RbfA) [Fructobacillus sp. LMG 32999]CAK1223893.1 Ribosome-binding factor RbfA (RbfA) [Fructobacillus sp. LMG 32999]
MANAQRAGRLAQEIQKDVTDLILKRVNDPRVQDVTVTSVEVSGDLQIATIYYSILSDYASDRKKAQAGLEAASGLIRRELGARLTVYKIPELHFVLDSSIQYGDHIEELIRGLHKKD